MTEMRWLDSITNSMDMNLGKFQEMGGTGKPGLLQSMELRRVGHDLVTEQNNVLRLNEKWFLLYCYFQLTEDIAVN